MKKTLLITLAMVCAWLAQAQLPNPGFESWQTQQLYEEPEDYYTNSLTLYLLGGPVNVTQVPGASGAAARLETVLVQGDTVAGYIANDPTFFRGIPFFSQPDSVRITARYNILPGDTAQFAFLFKRNGIPFFFPENYIVLTGQQNAFVTQTFPLNLPLPPDSLFFIASSSAVLGSSNAQPGSWIEIDAISLVNSGEQLPNAGLDSWLSIEYTEPEGWGTTNLINAILGEPANVREIAGHTGSAAQIEVVEINAFGDIDTFGFMANAYDFITDGEPGSPYTDQPQKLTFKYRYAPQGNDQAVLYVVFSKWDPVQQVRDSINGGVAYLSAASNWTAEEISFDWTGKPMPDTISVIMGAGDFFTETAVPGSVLDIDDLALTFPTGETIMLFEEKPVRLFPNPATEQVTIQLGAGLGRDATLQVFDVLGRQVYASQMGDIRQETISLQGWATGTYLYAIRQGEQRYVGQFIVP